MHYKSYNIIRIEHLSFLYILLSILLQRRRLSVIDVTMYLNFFYEHYCCTPSPRKKIRGSTNAWTGVEAGATIPIRWYERARAASLTRESKSRLRVCRPWFGWGYRPTSRTAEARFTLCFNTTTLDIVKAAVRDEIPLTDSLTPALEPFRRGLFNLLVLPLFNRIRKIRCFVESRVGVFEWSFEWSNLWGLNDRSRGGKILLVYRIVSCRSIFWGLVNQRS